MCQIYFFYLQGLQVQCFERITPFFSLLFVIFSIPAPLTYNKIILVLSRLFQAQCLFLPSHGLPARVSGSRQPNGTALQWAETRYCASLFSSPCTVLFSRIEHPSSHHCTAIRGMAPHGNLLSCFPSHYVYSSRIDKKCLDLFTVLFIVG